VRPRLRPLAVRLRGGFAGNFSDRIAGGRWVPRRVLAGPDSWPDLPASTARWPAF